MATLTGCPLMEPLLEPEDKGGGGGKLVGESEVFVGTWTGTGAFHDGTTLYTGVALKMVMTSTTWHFTATAPNYVTPLLADDSGMYDTLQPDCMLSAYFGNPRYRANIENYSYYCDGKKQLSIKYTDRCDSIRWYIPKEGLKYLVPPKKK